MIVRKSMPSLSDSNIYSAPKELPNKAPSTTTTWADDLCPPSQRNSGSGETDTFVAVRRFSLTTHGSDPIEPFQNRESDLLNAGIRRHSGRFCRRGECRRILPDELLHAQRPLPR